MHLIQEIKGAKLMYIKSTQKEAFPSQIYNIEVGKPAGTRIRFKTLTSFLDESHILRVGERIGRATVSFDTKPPAIIIQDHHVCRPIILDCHKKLHHEDRNTLVVNELRLIYWIPSSLSIIL